MYGSHDKLKLKMKFIGFAVISGRIHIEWMLMRMEKNFENTLLFF